MLQRSSSLTPLASASLGCGGSGQHFDGMAFGSANEMTIKNATGVIED
jgi:hypothetical protein